MVKQFLRWRYIRWAIAVPALPIALWACTSHPLTAPKPMPEQTSDIKVNVNPSRKVDMLFMIDNSMSMAPKQEKLAKEFPKLINALRDDSASPPLPDMRIAIISSDLGTGKSGRCLPQYGDRGNFQMKGNCGQKSGAKWLANEPNNPSAKNYDGDDIAKVFGCLAQAVGGNGCGFEQQLQAINFAFIVDQGGGVAVKDFIRDDAYLAIVLLTDEDDCSMPLESLMANPDHAQTESWSLRCASRGHKCSGSNLEYPTTSAFSSDYSNCAARADYCSESESADKPTSCTPLADIGKIVSNIKGYKLNHGGSEDMILVAAIFGKPLKNQNSATYRIDKTPNQTAGQPEIYDYWPVCYDPAVPGPTSPSGDMSKYAAATGMGGYGGLRIQAFLDKFPKDNALGFSICESDYSEAMSQVGDVLKKKLSSLCVPKKLMDVDPNTAGVQPDCQVQDVVGSRVINDNIPWCGDTSDKPCWRVESKPEECPVRDTVPSQHIVVDRQPGAPLEPNQSVKMACRTCVELKSGLDPDKYTVDGCAY